MRVIIASDHAGLGFKSLIGERLSGLGHQVKDSGPFEPVSVDYPVYARAVAQAVAAGEMEMGVLVCGTGIGMSMAANRVPGARAALCMNEVMARYARQHNDANILVLGERIIGPELALSILEAWLGASFEGGRHLRRVQLFDQNQDQAG